MIEWPDWHKYYGPLLHPIFWSATFFVFGWDYFASQGLYVVLPQYPKPKLVKNG